MDKRTEKAERAAGASETGKNANVEMPMERVVYRSYWAWAKDQKGVLFNLRKRTNERRAAIGYEIKELMEKIAELRKERDGYRTPTMAELTAYDKYEVYVRRCREFASKRAIPCVEED